jgi:hypothetical protein
MSQSVPMPHHTPPVLRCACGGFGVADVQEWCLSCGLALIPFPKHGDPHANIQLAMHSKVAICAAYGGQTVCRGFT